MASTWARLRLTSHTSIGSPEPCAEPRASAAPIVHPSAPAPTMHTRMTPLGCVVAGMGSNVPAAADLRGLSVETPVSAWRAR